MEDNIIEIIPSSKDGAEYVIKAELGSNRIWYNAYRRDKGSSDTKEWVRVSSTKNLSLTKRMVQNIISNKIGGNDK